jgi:hypothetical protein
VNSGPAVVGRAQLMMKNALVETLTSGPKLLTDQIMGRTDKVYLKKCVFLPPPGGMKTDVVIVLFTGIGLPPHTYTGIAAAIQEACQRDYNMGAYVVISKFFNNLGSVCPCRACHPRAGQASDR